MKATIPWLAALLCAGWITSSAQAFGILRAWRNRNNGDVSVTDQPARGGYTFPSGPAAGTANGGVAETSAAPASETANCDTGAGHHALPGYLHSIPGHFRTCLNRAKGCLENVPGRAPPPPKPLVINPYLRSPRDFFMMDDP
jgi:hypothetical protein